MKMVWLRTAKSLVLKAQYILTKVTLTFNLQDHILKKSNYKISSEASPTSSSIMECVELEKLIDVPLKANTLGCILKLRCSPYKP